MPEAIPPALHDARSHSITTVAPPAGISPGLTRLLALTAGVAVANIYYCQPMLGLIAGDLGVSGSAAGQVVTVTQLGYAAGLLLLIPLGDRTDRRRLILVQSAILTVALLGAAAAPSLFWLMVASAVVGVLSTLAQHAVPFAAELSGDATRGQTVGQVMSGLLAGILLARVLSGGVGDLAGWRVMYVLGAAITALLALVLSRALPRGRTTPSSYAALLLSLGQLTRKHPALRQAAVTQGLLFGAFSAFWATLALYLATLPGHPGASVAGAYGVIGLTGVAVAPWAGRLNDRLGARPVIMAGVACVLAGVAVLAVWPTLAGLALAVVLIDAGVQFAMISHQSIIFGLDPAARGRINTVYVVAIFIGAPIGSAASGIAWDHAGWHGVVAVAATLALAGAVSSRVRWGQTPRISG